MSRVTFLLAAGCAALAVARPAHAIDYVKVAVNRTGQIQQGHLFDLFGQEKILGDEVVRNEPFALYQQLMQPFVPVTRVHMFNDPVKNIPSTLDTAPPVNPPDAICRSGFSVEDHEFRLLGYWWCRSGSAPNVPIRTQEIADPSFKITVLDHEERRVRVEMINDSGRAVGVINLRAYFRPSKPPAQFLQTDPPIAGAEFQDESEELMQRFSNFTLAPNSQGQFSFELTVPQVGGGPSVLGGGAGDGPSALQAGDTATLVFRSHLVHSSDLPINNRVSMAVADQPFHIYRPRMIDAGACWVYYQGKLGVMFGLDSKDPDRTLPRVKSVRITPRSPGSRPSDVVFDPSHVWESRATSLAGELMNRTYVFAQVRWDETKTLEYDWVTRLEDAQHQVTNKRLILSVYPSGDLALRHP